jgi:sugar lactone lactonase YvrE
MVRDAQVESVLASGDRLGETPLWCERTRRLWWIDIERPRLQCFDPESGQHEIFEVPGCTYLGSLALTRGGDFLLARDLTIERFDPASGTLTAITEVDHGLDNRLNDGRVDRAGRFWVGTMDNALRRPNGSLYRIEHDGTARAIVDGVVVSNGIAHSPDGRTLWFTDTRRFVTWAFDCDPDDGTLSHRRVFAEWRASGDRPDGACVDVDGCLWTAFFSGARIVRYRPDGAIDREVPMPVTNPTCVCFGGPELTTLYVTTATKFLDEAQRAAEPLAGNLFAIEGAGQGLPEHRFG